ncbi:bifunctional folylpolyglutamate synthase/dihydrofolate synthase [Acetobacteraceae bacterium H6797]|nr:bifunctional folylpolyglutamate synthase/dihydrofolate synthase [Acetobacteraceae bacterium H6797]
MTTITLPVKPASPGRSEAIIDRLHGLHPKLIDLSLGRIQRLLGEMGHPEKRLPPVIHVAGTNGKGSTCAFLRAIGEAAGKKVHVYTSPHLVRFHERIRLAGMLVSEPMLAEALEEAERINAGKPITVFEITTAVAFELFARVPADMLVLEVGLGGLFDTSNVVEEPAVAAIASISIDHVDFLGDKLAGIAREKAGIIKPRRPVVTGLQNPEAMAVIEARAGEIAAPLAARDRQWTMTPLGNGAWRYEDAKGALTLPKLGLLGPHQGDNAGIAIAAMRAWNPDWLTDEAIIQGVGAATWPARMQRLKGPLTGLLPDGWELWLDGGHNAGGGLAIASQLEQWKDKPLHLVVGMKKGKASGDFLRPIMAHLRPGDTMQAVAEPGQHLAMPVEDIVEASGGIATPGPHVEDALRRLGAAGGQPARVLICGSLYLAGEVLKMDEDLV